MEETVIVIMLKDRATGFLDKELLSLRVSEHESLIVNMFAEQDGEEMLVHMKLTTDREVSDWEFSAIYDYYDGLALSNLVNSVHEIEDCYNPTWEVIFPFSDNVEEMEQKISEILELHVSELADVYETIEDKEAEYL